MVEKKKSICLFCSLGCGVAFRTAGENVLAIDYDGPLCARGHYNLELLNHPARLTEPQIGSRKVSWQEALSFVSRKLKESDPDSIAILLSANASNEEAALAGKLAKSLRVKNISACGNPADQEAYEGIKWEAEGSSLKKIEEIGSEETLLIIGDALTRSPVLSRKINQVKYGKRGNQIMVIDPNETHTTWFATTHIKNKPGTEALVLADMIKAAKEGKDAFSNAASGTIIFAPGRNKQRNDLIAYLSKVLASLSPSKKHLILYAFGNTLGVNSILDQIVENRASYSEIAGEIKKGDIKTLLMLGEDVSPDIPEIKRVDFISMSHYFKTDLVDQAVALLPLASHLEEKGSFTLADGRTETKEAVAPKVGGKSNLDILAALLNLKPEAGEIPQRISEVKVDLEQKLAEAKKITGQEEAPVEDITHFGNNSLVKNFYWFRVNNG